MTVFSQLSQSTLAARISCIVLLAALAGLATDAFLKVVYGAPAPASTPLPELAAQASAATPNWLASSSAAGAAAPSELKLLGVVAQGATGIALIQITGRRAQTVQVGQRLPDGTQLKSVQGKIATVLINNELRTLTLDTPGSAAASLVVNTAAPVPMPSFAAQALPDMAAQTALQLQQAQQLQQMQQAAVSQAGGGNGAEASAPIQPNIEATATSASKRRLGGRP